MCFLHLSIINKIKAPGCNDTMLKENLISSEKNFWQL